MSKEKKQPYEIAHPVAEEIITKLRPYCQRIEIAGSLRRRRPMIGDIELVALPKMESLKKDLFGAITEEKSLLSAFLRENNVKMEKNGPKFKQFNYGRFTVDLFLPASADHWGCIYLIRTGSLEFNAWLMNTVQYQAGLRFRDGRLTERGLPLDTPEEEDVFEALRIPFIPPAFRDSERWLLLAEGQTAQQSRDKIAHTSL